jgi:D-alanyl-D-alanine carboxypeptidase (penicillin-binding protein 5/6)
MPWVCVVLLVFALVPSVASAAASSKPAVSVPASALMTIDGQMLWTRHPKTRRRVASCIKMLNALVVRDRAKLGEKVTVTAKAARTEDGLGLVRGQKVTVRQLLKLMLVASSNDAAEALAIHVGGSEKKFVKMMNAKAKKLGLKRTHAIDPHGLSKHERSTSHDLAKIAREVMADPVLRKIVRARSARLPRPGGGGRTVGATNEMLGTYRGIEGVKTGFTYAAGYCFVGAAKRGKLELVGVVLGANSKSGRFTQMRKLLNWGFASYRMRQVVSRDTTYGVVQISGGTTSSVTVHAAKGSKKAVLATGAGFAEQMILPATLPAPIRRGDQLGVIRVAQDGVALASVALLADADIATVAPVPARPPARQQAQTAEPPAWHLIGGTPGRVWESLRRGLRLVLPVGLFERRLVSAGAV